MNSSYPNRVAVIEEMRRAPSSGVRYFCSTASCTCFTSFPATCHFGSMFLPNSVGFIAAYWWTSDGVMVSVITETPLSRRVGVVLAYPLRGAPAPLRSVKHRKERHLSVNRMFTRTSASTRWIDCSIQASRARRRSAAWAAEAKLIVVGIADAELANAPRLVLDELAHQTDRFARLPSTSHLGLQCGRDARSNSKQAACSPLLVQLVHLRRRDVDLGVVRKWLDLGAGAQVKAQTLPLGIAVAAVVASNGEAKTVVESHRRVEVARREDRRGRFEPHARRRSARAGHHRLLRWRASSRTTTIGRPTAHAASTGTTPAPVMSAKCLLGHRLPGAA